MNNSQIGSVALTLSVFIATVHGFGFLSERLKQPRLVGEILAGALLGPFFLGHWMPGVHTVILGKGATNAASINEMVLNFIYWIGLFMLMFTSGTETRGLLSRQNQRPTWIMLLLGTTLPLLVVMAFGWFGLLPLEKLIAEGAQELPALLVLGVAVSVTSIPVISRIFRDLGILHTRFASLVLGTALLEDVILWALLAVATSLAHAVPGTSFVEEVTREVLVTSAFMTVGLFLVPPLLGRWHGSRFNWVYRASPRGYVTSLIFLYVAVASYLNVNLVFGALLAGFAIVGGFGARYREHFAEPIEAIQSIASSLFIPIYFAFVGLKLDFGHGFSWQMLLVFLVGSSLVAIACKAVAARVAGFRGWEVVHLAITQNARGGPGIVLASVAYEAGIINGAFYTSLVLTAILTSQAAGLWLRGVLSRGMRLPGEAGGGR